MTELPADDLQVCLRVDDARTAQAAGARFTRTLADADSEDIAAALWEQEHLVERAIIDAGYSSEQAKLALPPGRPNV